MKKMVVFDLDDTLYKEVDFLKSAYKEIDLILREHYQLEDVYNCLWSAYNEGENAFQTVNLKYGIDIPSSEYLTIYRNHIPQIAMSLDTHKVLEQLTLKGVELGILTDGRAVTQCNKMHSLGLDTYISVDNFIVSETLGAEKPSLVGYLFFQEKYLSETCFYYVGDNTTKDFKAPNKLNWTSLCLLDNGQNIHKQDFNQPNDMLPTYTIKDISEVLHYV